MLPFPSPTTPASAALNDLIDKRREVATKLADAERSGTYASQERIDASAALQALERRRAGGDNVADAELKRAEKTLKLATDHEREPWGERVSALRGALRDADTEIQRHVAANYETLAAEIEADADAVKVRADDLLREIGRVLREREEIVERFTGLIGKVARVQPGLIPYTKLEPIAREAEALLMAGGEVRPVPRRDPRVPTAGVAVPDLSSEWTSELTL